MIVKDESHVITRCLASVKPIIDYWVIVDTGSSDGTQQIIEEFMQDVDGALYERPWVNFAHNRNEALALAKDKADYVLIIDADEVLKTTGNFELPELDKDFYYITTEFGGTKYGRVQLIDTSLDWKWAGVLHEALDCKDAKSCDTLQNIVNFVRSDGARSQDPDKFLKDAKLLETALIEDPNNTRNMFYLAQSLRDAGKHDAALEWYQKRIAAGGWDQEVFWSLLQVGLLQEHLKMPPQTIINSYTTAYLFRPTRVEPLYRLANFHRNLGNYNAALNAASLGLTLEKSSDVLFVEHWMYDYGLLLEFSIAAYWKEKYLDALLASNLILAQKDLPENIIECVNQNLGWIHSKMRENLSQSKLMNQVKRQFKEEPQISFQPPLLIKS